ncbi:hypothetical protein TRFO_38227 [Tritrichomonas foetus]|uniref:Importin N-terminal domain-containing protein n=1 Tax=Tritrichomonas foetus TaxID=1144522 RepID=A0A1J4JAC8_9EUKA|nr:hypothetical protein TRFO_38227 [Tritrichomonas foetus]|eukprot:OHS95633.1 hypothetical protein TRFO_38227 [Tritrichomonas foetus]
MDVYNTLMNLYVQTKGDNNMNHVLDLLNYCLTQLDKSNDSNFLRILYIILMNLFNINDINLNNSGNKRTNASRLWNHHLLSSFRTTIKNKLMNGIESNDIVVRNISARAAASIAFIDETYDVFIQLAERVTHAQLPRNSIYGSIRCLYEIYTFPIEIPLSWEKCFPPLILSLLEFIQIPDNDQNALIDAIHTLILFVKKSQYYFLSHEIINNCFLAVQNAFNTNRICQENITFYHSIFVFFYQIVKIVYFQTNEHIEQIFTIITNQIHIPSKPHRNICIDTIGRLALFEYRREKNGYSTQGIFYNNLSLLIQKILNCMILDMDEFDIYNDEELASLSTLKIFFRHNQQLILQNIIQLFDIINDPDFHKKNAALYSIQCICSKFKLDLVKQFIFTIIPILFDHLDEKMDLTTRYFALSSIESILLYYGDIFKNDIISNRLINIYFASIQCSQFSPFILKFCRVIKILATNCNQVIIDNNFRYIISLTLSQIRNEENIEFRELFSVIDTVIKFSSNVSDEQILELIPSMLTTASSSDVVIEKRSNCLLILATIFEKVPTLVHPNAISFGISIMTMINTKENNDSDLCGCSLIAVRNLLQISSSSFAPYINEILKLIYFTFNENDEWLIKISFDTISLMYESIPIHMKIYFPNTCKELFKFIDSNSNDRVFPLIPSILNTFSRMIYIFTYVKPLKIDYNIKHIFDLIVQFSLSCQRNEIDIFYIKSNMDLYEKILNSYKSLFIAFHAKKLFLFQVCYQTFSFIQFLGSIPYLNDNNHVLIYEVIFIAVEILNKNVLTYLNSNSITFLIEKGIHNNQNPQIKNCANRLQELIMQLQKSMDHFEEDYSEEDCSEEYFSENGCSEEYFSENGCSEEDC